MAKHRRKWLSSRLLTRGALVLASLVFTFLVLEIALRLIVPDNPPGTTFGKPVTRNSFGLRDRDFSIPNDEGTYRVVVLGDSFTWGVGLDVEDTLPKVLEKGLVESAAGGAVEVVNASEPGHNTVEEFHRLRDQAIRYEPDLVLVVYNLNDIEYLPHLSVSSSEATAAPEETEEESFAVPVVEIDPGEEITRYSRNAGLRGFVLKIERRSLFVRFLVPRVGAVLRRLGLLKSVEFSWVEKLYQGFTDSNPGWRESKRALAAIKDLCDAQGCEVLVAIYPLFAELENYKGKAAHETISSFCRDIGVEAVDLLPLFENTRTPSHWITVMDSHPNAAAHRAVAEHLLPRVRERVAQRIHHE